MKHLATLIQRYFRALPVQNSLRMKHQLLAFLFLILMSAPSNAQLDIILHEVDPGYSARHIAEDFEGNVLVVSGSSFIGKYNPQQNAYSWTTAILPPEGSSGNASVQDMTIDGSGNTYLTGWYTGSMAFGSIVLTSLFNSQHIYQKSDVFVTKLDPNGIFLWAKSFGTNAGTDRSNAIALDGSGNVYITGLFCNKICSGPPQGSPPETEDIYVAKLNNSGSLIWQKRFAPSKVICENGGAGHDITVDGSGNIYATGWFQGTFKFGNTASLTLTSQGGVDVFTIKLNSTGTALWARAGKGAGSDMGLSLFIDAGGNVNVGGSYGAGSAGDITFVPFILADVDGNGGAPGPLVSNAFLVQYTSAGTINWAINPAPLTGISNQVTGIIAGEAGTIRVSMPEVGIKSFSTAGTETEFIPFEDNFTLLDGYLYPKTTMGDMEAAASGFIFSERIRCGTVMIANLELQNQNCQDCADWYTCNAPSHPDLYIIRSANPPNLNSPIVNRSASEKADHANLDEMTVYPNPGWDQITIGLPAAFTTGVLKIFTLQGEEFMMYHLTTGGIIHLDIASYPAGMYACELRSKDDYWQKKFIKAE